MRYKEILREYYKNAWTKNLLILKIHGTDNWLHILWLTGSTTEEFSDLTNIKLNI